MTETHWNCDKNKTYCKLRKWSNKVIERDKECQRCGIKNNLEAHHMQKVRRKDKDYYNIEYGICLCRKCHKEFHKGIKGYFTRENTLKFIKGVKSWAKVIK